MRDESPPPDPEAAVEKLLDLILLMALKARATELYLSPGETAYRMWYRVNGEISAWDSPPLPLGRLLVNRLKALAKLGSPAEALPREGRLAVASEWGALRGAVSAIPAAGGDCVVVRLEW